MGRVVSLDPSTLSWQGHFWLVFIFHGLPFILPALRGRDRWRNLKKPGAQDEAGLENEEM